MFSLFSSPVLGSGNSPSVMDSPFAGPRPSGWVSAELSGKCSQACRSHVWGVGGAGGCWGPSQKQNNNNSGRRRSRPARGLDSVPPGSRQSGLCSCSGHVTRRGVPVAPCPAGRPTLLRDMRVGRSLPQSACSGPWPAWGAGGPTSPHPTAPRALPPRAQGEQGPDPPTPRPGLA